MSFARVLNDEKAVSCVQFLREAVAYYAALGVRIERVMTDNGAGYKNTFRAACEELGIRHIKTRPYTPQPTARPNASCRPACASGPTPSPTRVQRSARQPCCRSCIAITGIDLTPPSTDCRP